MLPDGRQHEHHGHDHGHEPHGEYGHDHGHEHGHQHRRRGVRGALAGLVHPHSHDPADSLDDALLTDRAARRALVVSLCGLLATGAIQAVIVGFSGSVGLLADTIHNLADALTALPIGLAFWAARRRATSRYTYGYGRAEDLAGLAVVGVMAVSAAVAAWQAIDRFVHPHQVTDLPLVAAAGVIGFAGNELAARYRIAVGTRIGSAALVADGRHARADGFTSLAVVAGAAGVALGWQQADPVQGHSRGPRLRRRPGPVDRPRTARRAQHHRQRRPDRPPGARRHRGRAPSAPAQGPPPHRRDHPRQPARERRGARPHRPPRALEIPDLVNARPGILRLRRCADDPSPFVSIRSRRRRRTRFSRFRDQLHIAIIRHIWQPVVRNVTIPLRPHVPAKRVKPGRMA
ncbi:MAG: cation diffusion facilitator family transporter [Trebonia sp.]